MEKTPRYVDGRSRDPRNPEPEEGDVERPELRSPTPGGDPEHKKPLKDETNRLTA